MGQGAKEHSTSPPWGHGDTSAPASAPSKAWLPAAAGWRVGAWSITGDPPSPPGPTRQMQVVQSSPSRLNRSPCAYVRPRKLHFAGEKKDSGAGGKPPIPKTHPLGSPHLRFGGPGDAPGWQEQQSVGEGLGQEPGGHSGEMQEMFPDCEQSGGGHGAPGGVTLGYHPPQHVPHHHPGAHG